MPTRLQTMPMDVQAPGFERTPALRARTGRAAERAARRACRAHRADPVHAAGNACGAHELSAIEGLLQGAVARQIIHNARGAALDVRAPATPKEKVAC